MGIVSVESKVAKHLRATLWVVNKALAFSVFDDEWATGWAQSYGATFPDRHLVSKMVSVLARVQQQQLVECMVDAGSYSLATDGWTKYKSK